MSPATPLAPPRRHFPHALGLETTPPEFGVLVSLRAAPSNPAARLTADEGLRRAWRRRRASVPACLALLALQFITAGALAPQARGDAALSELTRATAFTDGATAIAPSSATVYGWAYPGGHENRVHDTSYLFEYGTTTTYGSDTGIADAGSELTGSEAIGRLVGLIPGTAYHYRLVAWNALGVSYGSDQTFTTTGSPAPTATTGEADTITAESAHLHGTVALLGADTREYFEYGTGVVSETKYPEPGDDLGAGPGTAEDEVTVGGLVPGHTYYYRQVAESWAGMSYGEVRTFSTPPRLPSVWTAAGGTERESQTGTVGAQVNPNGSPTSYYFEYIVGGGIPMRLPVTPVELGAGRSIVSVEQHLPELPPDALVSYRVVASNAAGVATGAYEEFVVAGGPSVTSEAARNIGETTAELRGFVNPHGHALAAGFQYGSTEAYGQQTGEWLLFEPGLLSHWEVHEPVSGLKRGQTYHYRIFEELPEDGGRVYGGDQEFTTLPGVPVVATGSAINVDSSGATLTATVTPNGGTSECVIEYGTGEGYSDSVPCTPPAGSGEVPVTVSAKVTALSPGTSYTFRVKARNAAGTALGSSHPFETGVERDCVASDGKISGRGSSLQARAEAALAKAYTEDYCGVVGEQHAGDPAGRTMVTYNYPAAQGGDGTGDEAGLTSASCRTDAYAGSSIPYTEAELNKLNGAPGVTGGCNLAFEPPFSEGSGGAFPDGADLAAPIMSFPIGGSAIAIAANLAGACSSGTPTALNLTAREVSRLLGGDVSSWGDKELAENNSALKTDACTGKITRVLRADTSGEATIVKQYLVRAEDARAGQRCAENVKWEAFTASNTSWPGKQSPGKEGTCSEIVTPAQNGGPAEVEALEHTQGGVGYAGVPDETGQPSLIAATVQSAQGATYQPPKSGGAANCRITGVAPPGNGGAEEAVGLYNSEGKNWATDAAPNAENIADMGSKYPICGLMWDLVYSNMASATTPNANALLTADQRRTLYSYFSFILSSAAQDLLAHVGYTPLPAGWLSQLREGFQEGFLGLG